MIYTGLIAAILRGITLISKLALLLFLAKYIPVNEVGQFGIISVSIALSIYVLGLDFYAFNSREIISSPPKKRARLLRDQAVVHGIAYLIILPLLLFIFLLEIIPVKYIIWFYLILIFEHISQELYRIFISLQRPIVANAVMFLRSAVWIYGVIAVMELFEGTRSITTVWIGWVIGLLLSLILSAYYLKDIGWQNSRSQPINWGWITRGLKQASLFFISTLLFKIAEYSDRYFIQHYHGDEAVGVYTFFASISNAVLTFVGTGVIMVLYPKIVQTYQSGKIDEYKKGIRYLTGGVFTASILVSFSIGIAIHPIISYVGKDDYTSALPVFWILLSATFANLLSQIPHYALYAKSRDREIVISSLVAVCISIFLNMALVPQYGIYGGAIATLTGMISLGIMKLILNIRITPDISKAKSTSY